VPAPHASCCKQFRRAPCTGGVQQWLRLASLLGRTVPPPCDATPAAALAPRRRRRSSAATASCSTPARPSSRSRAARCSTSWRPTGARCRRPLALRRRRTPRRGGLAARRPRGRRDRGPRRLRGRRGLRRCSWCLARAAWTPRAWRPAAWSGAAATPPSRRARRSARAPMPAMRLRLAQPRRAWLLGPAQQRPCLQGPLFIAYSVISAVFCTRRVRHPAALAAAQQRSAAGAGRQRGGLYCLGCVS
jgi:hypothetical protein